MNIILQAIKHEITFWYRFSFRKLKVGDKLQTGEGLVKEYHNIEGKVIFVDQFGEPRFVVTKGNKYHKKGGRLFLSKQHYRRLK